MKLQQPCTALTTIAVAPLLLTLAGLAVLTTSWVFQYGFGYTPCALCLYQRRIWLAVVALGVAAMLLRRFSPPSSRGLQTATAWTVAATGGGLLTGAALAFYHVGVEWRWWPGPDSCSGAAALPQDLEGLKQALLTAAPVRCDEIPWTLFGLSMAGYNVLLSLTVGVYALLSFRRHLQSGGNMP